jgi:hypothetical protein
MCGVSTNSTFNIIDTILTIATVITMTTDITTLDNKENKLELTAAKMLLVPSPLPVGTDEVEMSSMPLPPVMSSAPARCSCSARLSGEPRSTIPKHSRHTFSNAAGA